MKATDRGLFYAFDSFVPISHKFSLVKCLIFIVYSIASTYQWFHHDLKALKIKFKRNGFPTDLIDRCTQDFLNKIYGGPTEIVYTVNKKPIVLVLPFLGQASYFLAKRLKQSIAKFYPCVELKVVFKRGFSIKDLFKFKDILPFECRSGVIYYTSCKKCGPSAAYLGKTKNTLYERFYSSNGHLNPRTKNSALNSHILETGDPECEFVFKDIEILGNCSHDLRLRYNMESIMLKIGSENSL